MADTDKLDPSKTVLTQWLRIEINCAIETLAIQLFYDRHNVRTGWFQASHETRTEFRELAIGQREFDQ